MYRIRLTRWTLLVTGLLLIVTLSFAQEEAPVNQQPAPTSQAALGYFAKPQYIGSAYCYACHLDIANDFAKTRMGRRFLLDPQNELEQKGCEGCHGPGSNHAISGGGASIGNLIEFRIDRGQSIEAANRVCLGCHNETSWHARTHGAQELACFDCHLVMERMTPASQLKPPYIAPWNRRRNWAGAALAGILVGLITGLLFRQRKSHLPGVHPR